MISSINLKPNSFILKEITLLGEVYYAPRKKI